MPTKATLVSFNVTHDDDGDFACEVLPLAGENTPTLASKIRVIFLDQSL